jgi:hypothetical protein
LHTMAGQTDGRRNAYAFPDTHRKQLHLFMARQRGYDFQCFVQHEWKQDGRHDLSWADVARDFGLSRRDHGKPTRWAGRSLERKAVRLITQLARKKILRANKTAKLEWAPPSDEDREYDGCVEPLMKTEQAPADTLGDNDEAQPDCVESLLAPTADGVIADLESVDETTFSEEAMVDAGGVALSYPSARNIQELLGDRTTNYVHLTGTVPPIPMFPLNPTGVVFGPVDRYAGFHHTAKVDETTVALTISTLVARMGAATLKKAKFTNDQFHEDEERKRISHQLQLYVEQVPDLHRVNYFKWLLTTKSGVQDLPLVNYYNGVMFYCSFMANGCCLRTTFKREQESSGTSTFGKQFEEKDEDDSLYGNDEDGVDDNVGMENIQGWDSSYLAGCGMEKVAECISDYCQKHIRHNGLLRFPALHLTFGLACLCRRLPSAVAEILSRPMYEEPKPNESHCRTPVELIQHALEYMEDNHLLEEDEPNFDSEDGAVQAALLEYWMYEAADVFRQCFKLDPVAVEYHLWYIGALSGCLLLCSGNRIGSGARRYPSEWNRDVIPFDVTFDGDDTPNPSPRHEIRSKLPKYEHIREELRHAVHLLLHNAKYQKSWAKMHLAVSSVLEWKQVIALLVGSSGNHSSPGHKSNYFTDTMSHNGFVTTIRRPPKSMLRDLLNTRTTTILCFPYGQAP